MRFIIFTSLFSLLGLFVFICIIIFAFKKMKPIIKTSHEVVLSTAKTINNATPAISHYARTFFDTMNSSLSSFNIELATERFQNYLSQNKKNIDYVDKMISRLDVQFKIEENSRKLVEDDYMQTMKDLDNYLTDSIRTNDIDLTNKIKEAKLKIGIIHNNIKCQKRFYVSQALCDELGKNV